MESCEGNGEQASVSTGLELSSDGAVVLRPDESLTVVSTAKQLSKKEIIESQEFEIRESRDLLPAEVGDRPALVAVHRSFMVHPAGHKAKKEKKDRDGTAACSNCSAF